MASKAYVCKKEPSIVNAIAVLADEGHLEMTKQILYSSFVFGNWKGEYILLVHSIKDTEKLKWFTDRGIHIVHTESVVDVPGATGIYYSKLRLFHPDCGRWKRILYLDTDMIVQWDLNELTQVRGFAAANDCAKFDVLHQFSPRDRNISIDEYHERKEIFKDYDLSKTAFNAGMMVIDSENNTQKRYEELLNLAQRYYQWSTYGDQGILNLYFQNNRIKLPYVFNDFYQSDDFNRNGFIRRTSAGDAVILHLTYPYKPWDPNCEFHDRWKSYTEKADELFYGKQVGKPLPAWRKWRTELINAFNIWRVIKR